MKIITDLCQLKRNYNYEKVSSKKFKTVKLLKTNFLKPVFIVLFFLSAISLFSQQLAVKTNVPYLATATPNLTLELGLSEKFTLDLSYGINLFTFEDNKKWKHWLSQIELRYWLCERFYGHFFGFHAGGGEYNFGRIKIPTVKDASSFRYEGWATMGGISYGYSWILGGRWNMEATLGIGVVYADYEKFDCPECGKLLEEDNKVFVAPTKVAVSVVYMLK